MNYIFFILIDRRCSHLLTGTSFSRTARVTPVTRGTVVLPVPTRDGLGRKTTSLSRRGKRRFTTRGIGGTHCHHSARLVSTGKRIPTCCLLENGNRETKYAFVKCGCLGSRRFVAVHDRRIRTKHVMFVESITICFLRGCLHVKTRTGASFILVWHCDSHFLSYRVYWRDEI